MIVRWWREDAFDDRRTGEKFPKAQVSVSTGKMERSTGSRFTNRSSSRHISCWLLISRTFKIEILESYDLAPGGRQLQTSLQLRRPVGCVSTWLTNTWSVFICTDDDGDDVMIDGDDDDHGDDGAIDGDDQLLQRWRCSSSPTASCPTSPLTGGSTQAIR